MSVCAGVGHPECAVFMPARVAAQGGDEVTPDIETLLSELRTLRADLMTHEHQNGARVVNNALLALRAVQWRPISEAPKDGTPVLGRSGAHYREVRWLARGWHDNDDNEWWPDEFMPLPEG